jgi:hypothetical protein
MSWDDYDEREDRLATPQEAVAEWAYNYGADHLDEAWLLHDWDVWVSNPHYCGPRVPYPEHEPDEYLTTDYESGKPAEREPNE